MYTAHIGQRVLERYNARHGTELDPRQFFDNVIFKTFFDDERFLIWINNAPFDQKSKQKKAHDPAERLEALETFHAETAKLTEPHGHLLLGGTARELDATTSGQVTDLTIPVDADDVYCSWIGVACGIGVAGGYSILLDHNAVLDALLDGWQRYRRWLNQRPTMKPQQMDSWNGWWLVHRFDRHFDADDPLGDFDPGTKKGTGNWTHQLDTPPWGRVLFALARATEGEAQTGYVYTLGNTNKTIGFLQLDLPQVSYLPALYEKLFGEHGGLDRRAVETLWETEFGFQRACEQGHLGTAALEPKDLRKYMPRRRQPGKLPKQPQKDKDRVTFHIYQTWIIAMLSNNERLLQLAQDAAEALHDHATGEGGTTTRAKQAVEKDTLATGARRAFIDGLTALIEKDCTHAQHFDRLVEEIVKMPSSDFPLLLTLIRFKYALLNC